MCRPAGVDTDVSSGGVATVPAASLTRMTIASQYAGLIVDLDGVVVHGDQPIRDAVAVLRRLRRGGQKIAYVTNNSSRTEQQWADLLNIARIPCSAEDVITSATATAYLVGASMGPKVFVVGSAALQQTLLERGATIVTDADEAAVVIVGYDDALTYARLRAAARAISRGARFLGTNPDSRLPTADGSHVPGNGAALAYLTEATGVVAEIAGKPQTYLFELARDRLALHEDGQILVIGDQPATDMHAAQRMGWDGALVLTGVASWASLIDVDSPPKWVVNTLGEIDGPEPPRLVMAEPVHVSQIKALLESVGRSGEAAAVQTRLATTMIGLTPDNRVAGTISWQIHEDTAVLRGIVVDPGERGHGTGTHLVVRALSHLRQQQVTWTYLLTAGAEEMFTKLGFWRVQRDRVPSELLEGADPDAPAFVRRVAP